MSRRLPEAREDYDLRVTLTSSTGERMNDAKCLVYLPKETGQSAKLYILPPRPETFRVGMYNNFWKFSLDGEERFNDEPYRTIHSDNVYLQGTIPNRWTDNDADSIWLAIPLGLTIQDKLDIEINETDCKFWILPSHVLTPAATLETSSTGFKSTPMHEKSFVLRNGLNLNFKTNYRSHDEKKGKRFAHHLIAESDVWGSAAGSAKLDIKTLGEIDDFLLIAALAARQPCICTGWESYDQKGHTLYFRGDVIARKPSNKVGRNDLVKLEHQTTFLKEVYPRFADDDSITHIRRVIHGLLAPKSTMEDIFIRLFSCLETMILAFREKNKLVYVFSEPKQQKAWEKLRKNELVGWLQSQPIFQTDKSSSESLGFVQENLPALDRISFSTAYNAFCKLHAVDLSDLWPVNDSNAWSLKTIRNKLAHGDVLGAHRHHALGVAMEHLRWTVERLLLGYFDWDISKSNVREQSLKSYPAHEDWKIYRRQMSDKSAS
jgi:hypothetical protein